MQFAATALACLVVLPFASSATGAAKVVSGVPSIVDGDTAWIGKEKIRFSSIDAPESDQVCLDSKGQKWSCGIAARDALIKFSAGRTWDCDVNGKDKYKRSLGKCFVEGDDISEWMVRSGWALSSVRYSHAYDRDEAYARGIMAGLWSGAFIAPWDWRYRNEKTEVLGGLQVPANAQKLLLGAVSSAGAPSSNCVIKAKVGGRECIYHLPGDAWYSKMNMERRLSRWFCSTAEAEAAGCRASRR